MGVVGLTTFIDKNTHLLSKHELKDCSVVVDGNNLYHHIYRACHVEARFGGDYDVYRQQLHINFKSLLKCGITPYVVLDGGYTTDNKKLKKCIERAKDRVRNAHIAKIRGECRMLPLLAYDTFIQTLEELGIPHVTCQYEADCEIAKLANKLKCPVISNDSDFYIFDLTHGFLPLDYLDFNPLYKRNSDGSKSAPFLHCQLYNIEGFLDSFEGLNRAMLPVFASLLGNDYAPPMAFQKIDETIQLPRKRRVHLSPRVSKVMKIIHWLTAHSHSSDNFMDSIKPYIKAQKKFFSSVEGYFDIDIFEGSDLFEYFSKRKSFTPTAASTFTGFNGSAFPTWFLLSICKGHITPAIINAAVLHRIIFLTQVEELSSPTIYMCSEKIRKVIYGILITSDPVSNSLNSRSVSTNADESCNGLSEVLKSVMDEIKPDEATVDKSDLEMCEESDVGSLCDTDRDGVSVSERTVISSKDCLKGFGKSESDSDKEDIEVVVDIDEDMPVQPRLKKQTQIEEYHREVRHLKRTYIDPILSIKSEPLPTLSEIGDLDKDKRFAFLLRSLDIDASVVMAFSEDLSLYVVSLITWIRHADPQITEHHLDCAILCPILLHMLDSISSGVGKGKKSKGENGEKIDLNQICHETKTVNKSKFYTVRDNLNRYRTLRPMFNRRKGLLLECDITHAFAQLQSCMYEISNLNKLLRFPLPNIQPAHLVNGSFLYNFYTDLISRPVPDNFLEAMVLKGSDMHNAFLSIKSVVLETVGGVSCFTTPVVDKIKKRRKKNKGKRKRKCDENVEDVNNVIDKCDDEESEGEVTTLEGFNIQNKFSLLTV